MSTTPTDLELIESAAHPVMVVIDQVGQERREIGCYALDLEFARRYAATVPDRHPEIYQRIEGGWRQVERAEEDLGR